MPWCSSKRGFRPLQDLDRLRHRRLDDVDLLEAARQRVVLLEDAAIFLVGGRADAAQLAVGEHRLDQVGGVHDAARGGAGADDRVDLVDEEDRAGLLLQLGDHALQALLEIAAVLGARDQRAHVERVDRAVGEHVRHLLLDDHARQALGDRGLADAGLADVQRVVLAAAAEDLDGALDFELAPDQRIDLAVLRALRSGCWCTSRARCRPRRRVLAFASGLFLRGLLLGDLRQAMGDEIDDVEPGDVVRGSARWTACVCFSLKIATSTLATVTSFLPRTARGRPRAAARAGNRASAALRDRHRAAGAGSCASMNFVELVLEAIQIRAAGAQDLAHRGVSRIDSSRCSTVRNSWRASRALAKASFRQNSSSCDTLQPPTKHSGSPPSCTAADDDGHVRRSVTWATLVSAISIREHTADAFALGMHFEHDASRASSGPS